jgi:hypothetical protein
MFPEMAVPSNREGTMGQFAWLDQVATLNAMLDTVDHRVAHKGPTPPGLEEFKGALDDLRLRAWGLLMATTSEDPHGFQERFRTHRGTEMCRALSTDLRTGKLSRSQPDLPALGDAARDLSAVVKKEVGRKPPKRGGKKAV